MARSQLKLIVEVKNVLLPLLALRIDGIHEVLLEVANQFSDSLCLNIGRPHALDVRAHLQQQSFRRLAAWLILLQDLGLHDHILLLVELCEELLLRRPNLTGVTQALHRLLFWTNGAMKQWLLVRTH